MSSVPPNMPPGGAPPPFPPYDPKTQWRVYREQQKAAWRAQRDAWKAQRHAWKASYVGAYGPRVPSVVGPVILIAVGVVALLMSPATSPPAVLGLVWPLVAAAADRRRPGAAGRVGAGSAPRDSGAPRRQLCRHSDSAGHSGLRRLRMEPRRGPMRAQLGRPRRRLLQPFGLPEHDIDQQVLNAQIPANASIEIQNPRGDVSVTAGDGSNIEVQAHEVAYAGSDAEAKKIFDAEAAHVTVSGSAVLVKSESNNSGRLNLTVTVPKTAQVTVNSGKGDVTAAGLGAGINVQRPRRRSPERDHRLGAGAFLQRQARLLRPPGRGRPHRRRRLQRPHLLRNQGQGHAERRDLRRRAHGKHLRPDRICTPR